MQNPNTKPTRETAINDLIFLESVRDEMYKYHPSNPNKVSLIQSYNDVLKEIEQQEKLIETLS